jgi:hypothetical protein
VAPSKAGWPDGRMMEAPMRRRKTSPPTLRVRVSHEVSRLEAYCLADAFERLLPIIERRLRPPPDRRGSPRAIPPNTTSFNRREWA